VQVVVSVVDINDNSPSFPQRRVSVEVSEGAALGTRLPLPAAVDLDHAQYSVQRYELTEQSAMFRLETDDDADEVWLTLAGRLDRERQSTYSLIVNAFDGGTPPNSAALDVQVCIQAQTQPPALVVDIGAVDVQVCIQAPTQPPAVVDIHCTRRHFCFLPRTKKGQKVGGVAQW